MIIVNFSHPFSTEQLDQLEDVLGAPPERIINVPVKLGLGGTDDDLLGRVAQLLRQIDLTPLQWRQEDIAINLPRHNLITAIVLAMLRVMMGYWPPILRMRPVPGAQPPRFEVASCLDLATVRTSAASVDL